MQRRTSMLALARSIDQGRAEAYASRLAEALPQGSEALAAAILLCTAYPAIAPRIEASPNIAKSLTAEGYHAARSRAEHLARLRARIPDTSDTTAVLRELRVTAERERIRIALREALPASLGGADVDVTARELAALADATIEIALEEARTTLGRRFGQPRTENGDPARFVVLGMGKLGGDELNPGSDVDLIYLYDTDEGAARSEDGSTLSLHDFWTRVAKRLTATLDEVTEDGFVWRVDLRLRPEGRGGALVNSLAAAERYYESFGRLWERAALLRARPVAGDRGFGDEALSVLEPFLWRRRVDPGIAVEMGKLAERARAELSADPTRDLKLGPGGIREAEFFVQSLELIWGGREPRVRARGTLDGLRRLRAAGFVTDREGRQLALGYLALRRAEHAIQLATGVQTHELPKDAAAARRLARMLGLSDEAALREELSRHMERIASLLASLAPFEAPARSRWTEALGALERGKRDAFVEAVATAAAARTREAAPSTDGMAGPEASDRTRDAARDLFELSRHPDAPLGTRSREVFPRLAEGVLDAVMDAADPEQAARYLRIFFARVKQPGVYVHLLGSDPRAVRRLVEAIGASALIGDALIGNPELGDVVLFARRAPSPEEARAAIESAVEEATKGAMTQGAAEDPEEALVEALRRAKARVTIEVGLADLQSEIGPHEVGSVLSALADASLEAATRFALQTPEGAPVRGLAVLAMGKLGGREIGYGSDLDVIFLFDPAAAPKDAVAEQFFARSARRIIRLISMSHPAGPGYELDTRLRPSGSQGLLVTSIDAFARYHGISRLAVAASDGADEAREAHEAHEAHEATATQSPLDASHAQAAPATRAAIWERLALLRARACAGDAALGTEAIRIAEASAYGRVEDAHAAAREIHRLRMRMERELSQERGGRYDPKLGRGGLSDVEFCVQLLQMLHGARADVRTTETEAALEALASIGILSPAQAETLRDGFAFLRKLQRRIRIVHASASQLIEEDAPGLSPLARRMGLRDRPGAQAGTALCAQYKAVTDRIRAVYEEIVVGAATTPEAGAEQDRTDAQGRSR